MDKEAEKLAREAEKAAAKIAKAETKAAKEAERDAKRESKRAEFAAEMQARKDDKQKREDSAGKEIASELLGGKFVKFYENGYVSVSAWGGGAPEKLIEIITDTDISKKTGLGRGVVAVATFGLNLATSSNMRGDIYLSIVTEEKTHMIHVSPPSERDVKTARKIEATGQGLLARQSRSADSKDAEGNAPLDITEQLSKLVELHKAGVLTDEEFKSGKAKIIGQ